MKRIVTSHHDGTAVIQLDRGVTNALDLGLVDELAEAIRGAKDDPDTHSVVLASSNDKFFSIGFDIPRLYRLSREDFETFYRRFNQTCLDLYTTPKPTVAAITGHAIAGGCILALCCDYRLIADGKKLMGLNEIKLGVPVPYLGDCVLRALVGDRKARDIMEIGDFFPAEKALEMGLVDQVLPLEKVSSASIERARMLGESPPKALRVIKQNRVEPIEAQFAACLDRKIETFLDCWYSADARDRLKEAIKKF
jgi:enoyl-CoA hydratase/carnithine racemase